MISDMMMFSSFVAISSLLVGHALALPQYSSFVNPQGANCWNAPATGANCYPTVTTGVNNYPCYGANGIGGVEYGQNSGGAQYGKAYSNQGYGTAAEENYNRQQGESANCYNYDANNWCDAQAASNNEIYENAAMSSNNNLDFSNSQNTRDYLMQALDRQQSNIGRDCTSYQTSNHDNCDVLFSMNKKQGSNTRFTKENEWADTVCLTDDYLANNVCENCESEILNQDQASLNTLDNSQCVSDSVFYENEATMGEFAEMQAGTVNAANLANTNCASNIGAIDAISAQNCNQYEQCNVC